MFLMDSFLRLTKNAGYRSLYQASEAPEKTQRDYLERVLRQNADTTFGKHFDFASLNTLEAYRERVPIQNLSQYRPLLDAVYRGKSKALMQHPARFFAMTAGTSDSPHVIPVNAPLEKEITRAFSTFFYFLEHELPELQHGKKQLLIGSGLGGDSPSGVSQGYFCGWNDQNDLRKTHRGSAIPNWVFTLEHSADRYYAMARYMMDDPDIVAIGCYTPECLVQMAKIACERSNSMIRDLENGTLKLFNDYPQMPQQTRLNKHPELAEKIKALHDDFNTIPEDRQRQLIRLMFPSLNYVLTWMSASMDFTLNKLSRWYEDVTLFEMPTIAAEGVIAIPFRAGKPGGILAAHSHFFEFIREDHINDEAPPTLMLWELVKDARYYVVLTTSGGLYRYNLEDLVEVTHFWGSLPVVRLVSSRGKQLRLDNGCNIVESEVVSWVKQACQSSDATLEHFVLAPSTEGTGATLLIEGMKGDFSLFSQCLVKEFVRRVSDTSLRVAEVGHQGLSDYIQRRHAFDGLPNTQFKPFHLSTNPAFCNGFKIIRHSEANPRGRFTTLTPRQQGGSQTDSNLNPLKDLEHPGLI